MSRPAGRPRRLTPDAVIASTLLVFAALALGGILVSAYSTVLDAPPDVTTDAGWTFAGQPRGSFPTFSDWIDETALVLHLVSVSPPDHRLTFLASMQLAPDVRQRLVDQRSGRPAASTIAIDPTHANDAITVTLDDQAFRHQEVTFPLSELLGVQSSPTSSLSLTSTRELTLPSQVDLQVFPSERFASQVFVTARLPAGVVIGGSDGGQYLNLHVHALIDDDLTGWAFDVGTFSQAANPEQPWVAIRVQRTWLVQLYTYLLALSPIALIVVTLHLGTRSRGTGATISSVVIPLAAATLTVLPLRAVLVPADVSGLTRVDMLLGLEFTMMMAAAVLVYWWAARGLDVHGPAPAAPSRTRGRPHRAAGLLAAAWLALSLVRALRQPVRRRR